MTKKIFTMDKFEAIRQARKLEAHLLGFDSGSGDAATIHALLSYIAMLEDCAEKLCKWDIKYPISFAQLPRKDAEAAETDLDDIIIDFRGLIQGRIIGGLEE